MIDNHDKRELSVFVTSKLSGEKIAPVDHKELQPKSIGEQSPSVIIHRNKVKQEVLGFGGAFTEASASVYQQCSQEKRAEIIKAYFDSENGHGYSFCRTHINSCDFSLGNYAYCETNGDYQLNNFSIEHYHNTVCHLRNYSHIMCNKKDRHSKLILKFFNQL